MHVLNLWINNLENCINKIVLHLKIRNLLFYIFLYGWFISHLGSILDDWKCDFKSMISKPAGLNLSRHALNWESRSRHNFDVSLKRWKILDVFKKLLLMCREILISISVKTARLNDFFFQKETWNKIIHPIDMRCVKHLGVFFFIEKKKNNHKQW